MIRVFALLPFAALALLLTGCPSKRCSRIGCPEGQICSQFNDRCLTPDEAYGQECLGPRDCHAGICVAVSQDPTAPGLCTGTCLAGDPACPSDMACVLVGTNEGGLTRLCSPAGATAVGFACASGFDCTGAMCLPLGDNDALECSGLCDPAVDDACGGGNTGCLTLPDDTGTAPLVDDEGGIVAICVAGGTSAPGEPCPDGILDCDLSRSDICLSSTDGTVTLCSPACPNGVEDCGDIENSCCVDLGVGQEAPFCLPPAYCGCEPDCLGKNCGDDGCGFACGSCGAGQVCQAGVCSSCTPDCTGLACGDDGCGGSCGSCNSGEVCNAGVCEASCTPDCTSRTCGDDGCGGLCGTCTAPARCHTGACVDPALLLVEIIVRDPALAPPETWGLGEFTSPQSVGPPVIYGQGPQAGTTQRLMCGTDIVCSDVPALSAEVPYEVILGYNLGAGRVRCTASFTLHDLAPADVALGDCGVAGGGPFDAITVTGATATPQIEWSLP